MNHPQHQIIPRQYLVPFILITSLFALWGFANDITNPLVAAFGRVMEISTSKAALVQLAFYGGYFTMAIPAALFVIRFSYKVGILIGLGLYAIGALLFWPAASYGVFEFFLIALYILTFGLAFLETTANPFILSMGSASTATRRLNLAQAFNPMGSLLGMYVAQHFILKALHSDDKNNAGEFIYSTLQGAEKAAVSAHDLMVIRNPYVILGLVVLLILLLIAVSKMPVNKLDERKLSLSNTFALLIKNAKYYEGVIAQMFYVAAQIMCWTFIIHYADNIGISYAAAQTYNIVAMSIFLASRFISTFLMKYINPGKLLMWFAVGGMLTSLGTIFIVGHVGLICLVATSAFMSLMFPTIYGIALDGMGEEAKLGAAGLVMAIVGGAVMPPLQGAIIDLKVITGFPAVNVSFILPLLCFVIIAVYGYRCHKVHVVL
jgi:FHS family L-fucose permease-like MFS transporter